MVLIVEGITRRYIIEESEVMTILELFYNVKDCDKDYLYWSVDDNNEYILLKPYFNADFFLDTDLLHEENIYDIISFLIEDDKNEEYPRFIPYSLIKSLENISIEFEGKVWYDVAFKYALVCVRGACDGNCSTDKLDLYCFPELPCMDKRPDCNCFTGKWPNFYNLITDVVKWVNVCQNMDALVVMFEFLPNTSYKPEGCLCFDCCTGLLIKNNHITVLDKSKIKTMYEEYNEKYPTNDREIEDSFDYEDGETLKKFRF